LSKELGHWLLQKKDETYFRTLLQALETTPGLYFSYETDLTLNLQRRCKLAEGWNRKPMWKQADPRYVWNWHLLEDLIECKLDGFIIPILQGNILFFIFLIFCLACSWTVYRCNVAFFKYAF
jgi:hypothetical protein